MSDEKSEKTVVDVPNTSSGLDENLAAALAYLPLIGLIQIFTEKKSTTVRFHSVQSILLAIGVMAVGWIPVLGWLIAFLSIFVFLYCAFMAYDNKKVALPVIGEIAEKQSKNLTQ